MTMENSGEVGCEVSRVNRHVRQCPVVFQGVAMTPVSVTYDCRSLSKLLNLSKPQFLYV